MSEQFDLVVIGAGPGGYVAAIKAAQLGMKVACVDKRSMAGGTCLNIGCIPSKALLTSSHKYWEAREHFDNHGIIVDVKIDIKKMQLRKTNVVTELTKGVAFLFRKNGVTFINGSASIKSSTQVQIEGGATLETKSILIATGSVSATLPNIDIDEEHIVTSTGALDFEKVPKHLVVIGGGVIGLELGSVWARLGAAVTVVEYFDRIVPSIDSEVATAFQKSLVAQGIVFRLGRKVVNIVKQPKELALHVMPANSDTTDMPEIITCDKVLVATGRRPNTDGLGLQSVGIETDKRGFVTVNTHYQTSVANIFAIGDVIPGPMLAHKAEEEGIAVVEYLAGQTAHVNYDAIPSVIYTQPEVASVGLTEDQAKEQGLTYKIGKFPFLANSRAKATGDTTGFVKIVADAKTDKVLGVHIIGEQAGNMIAEATLAMEFCASSEDIARTCHAHPTHSEALKEAAMATYSKAIHI
ncbi:dihydrolipoyl dehydrogenase [Candidatus Odyssella acanthamoebae]|uniref:Dihydrolipoyl dehydrogenase n=1 Tax=Candidatus Odyssella acanthamoebae TaxID=91604 RepID=A0A077AUN7_9PROT|nr:dihydrolipoyl dehydrogenase [Candidatus Paracaedibacter acanthamoebae]AIK95744.1 dihydrolipoamide dehydrogenase [Candidatus Paracaedibacter acanthamoebae]